MGKHLRTGVLLEAKALYQSQTAARWRVCCCKIQQWAAGRESSLNCSLLLNSASSSQWCKTECNEEVILSSVGTKCFLVFTSFSCIWQYFCLYGNIFITSLYKFLKLICFCLHRGGGGGGGGGWRAVQDRDQFYRYNRKAFGVWLTIEILIYGILGMFESSLG